MSRPDGRLRIVPALALGLAAFLLYLPSLRSDFVYDAEIQIKSDAYVHTPSHLADVVTFRVLAQDVLDGTRPVHLLSLMTDSLVWGRNPLGYHLTSNLLHGINAALLFLLLARLGAQVAPRRTARQVFLAAAAGVAIFVAHPILTEPVSEVSDREDLLALFFTLAALLLATRFPGRTPARTAGVGAACLLALLLAAGSKETGFVTPVFLALYAWLFRDFIPRRPWGLLVAAAFVVVGAFAIARFELQPETSKIFTSKPGYVGGSFAQMLTIQPRIWTFLVANIAWPVRLSADYTPQNVSWITPAAAALILLSLLAAQAVLSFKSRLALLGAAIFWLGLAPVSNFIPIYKVMADRFLYMPMAGVAATCCAALLLVRWRRAFLAASAAAFAVAIAFATLAWQRQAVFANSLNLWRDTTEKSPHSGPAWNNLGWALSESGKYEQAMEAFARALQLSNRRDPDTWAGAAITLDKMGRPAQAEAALREAIAIDPRFGRPDELVEAVAQSEATASLLKKILSRQSPP